MLGVVVPPCLALLLHLLKVLELQISHAHLLFTDRLQLQMLSTGRVPSIDSVKVRLIVSLGGVSLLDWLHCSFAVVALVVEGLVHLRKVSGTSTSVLVC